jgi:adenine deaminase
MAMAANALRECGGGFAVVQGGKVTGLLPLPIGGLLADTPWQDVACALEALHAAAHETGCTLSNPFLALAFLPLPVIPHARITLDGFVTL